MQIWKYIIVLDITISNKCILTFIVYPLMYCSKYRPSRAVEYKPADRILRTITV